MISAIMGSILVFCIAIILARNGKLIKKVFIMLGKNTIGIVYFQFIGFRLVNILISKVYGLNGERVRDFPVNYDYNTFTWKCVYLLVGIVLSIMLYKLFIRLFSIVKSRNILNNCGK